MQSRYFINARFWVIPPRSPRMLRHAISICCLFMCPLWLQAQITPKKKAVLVGIDEYQHSDLNKPKLQYAQRDVTVLKTILEKSGYSVTLLTGDQATQKNIFKALDDAKDETNSRGVFLVAFAGHGMQPEKSEDAFFVPYDAKQRIVNQNEDPWNYQSMVALGDVLKYLKASPAGSRLMMVDACRNDPTAGRGRGVGANLKVNDIPNTAVFLSCSAGQKSFEDKAWGGGHGVFFHHVIRGLSGAEPSTLNRNQVDIDRLWTYLKDTVPEQVKEVAKDPLSGTAPDQKPFRIVNGDIDLQILAKAGGIIPKMVPKEVPENIPTEPKAGEERAIDIGGGVHMVFCWIPKGTAILGSPAREFDRHKDYEAEHEYEVTTGFWMGKYPVTQAQWLEVMKNHPTLSKNPSYFTPNQDQMKRDGIRNSLNFPVDTVSWNDCQEFIAALNKRQKFPAKMGKTLALPTENQWEYAYRGGLGNKQPFYWGNTLNGTEANVKGTSPYGTNTKGLFKNRTTEVGEYEKQAPHPWGLCDMSGNVRNWCENVYDSRMLLGSGWNSPPHNARAAYRLIIKPTDADNWNGFRLVLLP